MDNNFSTADLVNKTNDLILSGFNFPDKDGFRNTIDRNEAVLNNSFSKQDLVKTLTEISDNSATNLKKVNSDTVNFFKWKGKINDLDKVSMQKFCEFRLPWEQIISPKERNEFKLKQFYRKWITIDDLYQNWNTFKFLILVFVDSKIYSEYMFWIDDQEVIIKFKYTDAWVMHNSTVTIYKFDTQFQKRIKINRNQMNNLWDWKIPLDYFSDEKILNYSNLICYVNKISNLDERKEKDSIVEVVGHNLEFISVSDGSLDCSKFSILSKDVVKSEKTEWVNLSIFVPKNFFEFPLLLPVDYVNQHHVYDLKKVFTFDLNEDSKLCKSDLKQLYVDESFSDKNQSKWVQMIRPIVLSDAFLIDKTNYTEFLARVKVVRNKIIEIEDLVEQFQTFVNYEYSDTGFDEFMIQLESKFNELRSFYNDFLTYCNSNFDLEFESEFTEFLKILSDLKENRIKSKWLSNKKITNEKFWFKITPLINIPMRLIDNFYNLDLVHSRKQNTVWETQEDYINKIRFTRPVDESNIWIFEYDQTNFCWRPNFDIEISYHYPDTYILSSKDEDITNKIFKAFIFYTDLINVREEIIDKVEATSKWDKDFKEFELERFGKFRDIFIEKFYWMALKSIYKDILFSDFRWEIIEHVYQNNQYDRFNKLFLDSVDPFFKLSLINYLKGNNYNFPTESAIEDFKKSLRLQWNDFRKLVNFQLYLEKNWKPSYFDFVKKINSQFDLNSHLEDDKVFFKFENIYDIDIQYEVFINGKQITDFTIEHINSEFDKIKFDQNYIEELQNSFVTVPEVKVEVYKCSGVEIIDPGAGYAVGQNIFIKKDNNLIKLQVTETQTNLKGIGKIILPGLLNFDPAIENSEVLSSCFENIDDEYGLDPYDKRTNLGLVKAATFSYPINEYWFTQKRYDNLLSDDRNAKFQYQEVSDSDRFPSNGDPEFNWYLGTRVDNRQVVNYNIHKWNGFISLNPVTDSFISDEKRINGVPNETYRNEYQLFEVARFHLDLNPSDADLVVQRFSDLPKFMNQWNDARDGKIVKVLFDETYNNSTMSYRVRGFLANGQIIYNLPVNSEQKLTEIMVNWNDFDCYFDFPSLKAQYENANWTSIKFYRIIEEQISDHKISPLVKVKKINKTSYIDKITIDDLAVFNWTTKQWEDLTDISRWEFTRTSNGFILKFKEEATSFSYIFKFYLIKSANSQQRNYQLKRNAKLKINSTVVTSSYSPEKTIKTNIGNNLVVRKLFPYEYKKEFTLSRNHYEMNLHLPPYMHFRNQLFLEDIKVYNKTTKEFEDILDTSKFRVDFSNDDAYEYSNEIQTTVKSVKLLRGGKNFINGTVWGWNEQYQIHLFGNIKASYESGVITEFNLTHLSKRPPVNSVIEFELYQNLNQTVGERGTVAVELETKETLVIENGYINKVTDPMAPLPESFRIYLMYNLPKDSEYVYEISISKKHKEFILTKEESQLLPEFQISDSLAQSSLYILTPTGRLPLINSSTQKPTFIAEKNELGTKIKLLNLYEAGTELRLISEPYSMRSVFTLRKIPEDGLIDMFGLLNKPLNKKYFEFWVNGKLLTDEVTIISPTKFVLHGLTSLRNLEIIELDRNPNEYFSDTFLLKTKNYLSRSYKIWNFDNYLDAALDGRLFGDNYSKEEKELLTYPVYPQISSEDEEFSNYPINSNNDLDVLAQTSMTLSNGIARYIYNILVFDFPSINGVQLSSKDLSFEKLGFKPFTSQEIVDELNEVWKDEITSNNYLDYHVIIDDKLWVGAVGSTFDENGNEVNPEFSAFSVMDNNIIIFDEVNQTVNLEKNETYYNLD